MHARLGLAASLLLAFSSANPVPASVNAPISDAEWANLKEGGLKARNAQPAQVNQPISDAEWQALEDGGLRRRDGEANALVARDKVMNCGHKVNGKGGNNGHGVWIPVQQFAQVADEFCGAYTGTDISQDHETSDTYPITLTNQDDDSIPGSPGNIVFAIYNTERAGSYLVDHDTCLKAMKAPLGVHVSKRDDHVQLAKRDSCWGHKHNDYEGGYYKIDGIGAFGSEVYN